MMANTPKMTTTLVILAAIAASPNGLSFTECQRIAYERSNYPKKYTRANRGFWSSMTECNRMECNRTPSGEYYERIHNGLLTLYCNKAPGRYGRYTLNEVGEAKLDAALNTL